MSSLSTDLSAFPSPHLAVDIVLFTIHEGELKVLMTQRTTMPFAGRRVLPGGFVHPGESLDDTARRVLRDKANLPDLAVEQLYTFSAPDRDPRGWVVTSAYFALVPYERLHEAAGHADNLWLPTIRADRSGKVLDLIDGPDGIIPGFDHGEIIRMALLRLRGKLDWSRLAFALLPECFTLFELQKVHETILGRSLNKPQFRKKWHARVLPDGLRMVPTGTLKTGRHRPAELYALAEAGV